MRTVRSTITLLLAFLLTAALCGCAASSPGESPGSAPAKPVDATDFMSNAGPVFPLTLAQAEPALFADRELLLDCAPYAEENTAAITVTDRYTIRNDSGEDCTVTALYPFVSSLSDLNLLQPVLTADGVAVKSTLYPGAFPGWFGPASPEPENAEERWNIRHAESGGVYLVARAHGADDRNARLLCGKHQPHFARDGVDGVDHVVILREIKLRFFSGQEKGLVCRHLTVGIDGADTGFRCVDLEFADGLARGKNLTVDVGQADPVVVDQVERARTGARQRLYGIAADAADAEDGNTASGKDLHCLAA